MSITLANTSSYFVLDLTHGRMRSTRLLTSAACIMLSLSAFAQEPRVGVRRLNSDWASVRALAHQSRIRITSDSKKTVCFVDSVTEDHLTCSHSQSHGGGQYEYSRDEIKEVKLASRSRSTVGGAALGIGIGAGAGALIGIGINGGDKGSLAHTSNGKAIGVGAALGSAALGIVGGAIGYGKDSFAGPLIYRRP